jgi:predicted short-subunit dehydrogenase-like oxidoreductase (DUF2520 family)
MIKTVIIGAGRLGTTLGYALTKKGYSIEAISCRRSSSAEESRRIIGQGVQSTDNLQAAKQGDLIILSVPDDVIEAVVSELASSDIDWAEKTVFHCSGYHSSGALSALRKKGALTASLHPVQTFPKKEADESVFHGIYFGLEGEEDAVYKAKEIVRSLGAEYVLLDAQAKPLFHAACSVASNHLAALLGMSSSMLEKAGLDEELSLKIVFPLVQRTLQNVKKIGASAALTGPLIRGDQKTLLSHLRSLDDTPDYSNPYKSLARLVLQMAERDGRLPSEKIKTLRDLLEDK